MNSITKKDIVFPVHHRCKSDGCGECIKLATITCRKVLGAVDLLKQKINKKITKLGKHLDYVSENPDSNYNLSDIQITIHELEYTLELIDEVFDIQNDEVGEK